MRRPPPVTGQRCRKTALHPSLLQKATDMRHIVDFGIERGMQQLLPPR
jgi:hypothetical protein